VAQGWTARQLLRRVWRPRVLVYGALLTLVTGAWLWSLTHRHDVQAVLIKDRGSLARQVGQGAVENTYRLQLTNSQEQPRRFTLQVQGVPGLRIDSDTTLTVQATASVALPVRLVLPAGEAARLAGQSLRVVLLVTPENAGPADAVQVDASFIVPR